MPSRPTPLRRRPASPPVARRMLLAAPTRPVLDAASAVVADPALAITRREPTLLEIRSRGTAALDVTGIVQRLGEGVAPGDAAVVRVVVDDGVGGVSLATALTAPALTDLVHGLGSTAVDDARRVLLTGRHRCRAEYQPIVDLRAEEAVVGYEALLRADGPGGPLAPGALFAAAASLGVGADLERAAWTAALGGAGPWLGAARLFVNLSPAAVDDVAGLARSMTRGAQVTGLDPRRVVVELTESGYRRDVDRLVAIARALRERGFRVALDDVGSGWSTLDAVVRVRPDVVKIEGTIVRALPDPAAAAVVTALVDIAHAAGAEVVAEGVETPTERDVVRRLGVDLGQGHLFGAAAPPRARGVRTFRSTPATARRSVATAG